MDVGRAQAFEVRDLLNRLAERIGALNEAQVCCHNVSYSEYRALRAVQQQGAPALGELATSLSLSPSGLTRLLDRLDQKGYARRSPSLLDARAAEVHLTPHGEALLQRIDEETVAYVQQLLTEIPEPMRPVLVSALRTLEQAERQLAARQHAS